MLLQNFSVQAFPLKLGGGFDVPNDTHRIARGGVAENLHRLREQQVPDAARSGYICSAVIHDEHREKSAPCTAAGIQTDLPERPDALHRIGQTRKAHDGQRHAGCPPGQSIKQCTGAAILQCDPSRIGEIVRAARVEAGPRGHAAILPTQIPEHAVSGSLASAVRKAVGDGSFKPELGGMVAPLTGGCSIESGWLAQQFRIAPARGNTVSDARECRIAFPLD